jgi:glycosyltransferase involved in cell wall biosynthesis
MRNQKKIPTVSVLINCYNYEKFVGEAIQSVVSQTNEPDELIIVDDGSTDGSVEQIKSAIEGLSYAKLVTQENGGQLSAFQSGWNNSSADWIFFLDADDVYKENHIESVMKAMEHNLQCDFFFTDCEEFGDGAGRSFHYHGPQGDLGYSAILVLEASRYVQAFVGGVTSTLCMRRTLLDAIFPFNSMMLDDWRIRADNVLIFGSSVAGARKYAITSQTLKYRLHGENHFAGQRPDRSKQAKSGLCHLRLLGDLKTKIPYDDKLASGLALEYRGIPNRNGHIRKIYWKASFHVSMSLIARLRLWASMMKSELFT